ncbi:MAG: hypothetical protein P4L53_01320 [Candidatus Obscuribacterales bacterium]|nr:hypothetical protein [Candidatus Obscuribacterales bacterium]
MASPAELRPNNDRVEESKAKIPGSDLPHIDRLKVLADMDTVPKGKPTASLQEFYLGGAKDGQTGADVPKFVAKTDQVAAVPKFVAKTDQVAVVGPEKPAPAAAPMESAMSTLTSANATAQQKIEAVSKLYDTMPKDGNGRVHLTLHDGDKDKHFEISKEKLGHGVNLTHLTYRDEKGHIHPVLRGVERKGHVDQEQDKHGNKADFKGDWWSKHAGDSAISQFAPSTDAKVAPVPPIPDRDREKAGPHEPEKTVPVPPIPERDREKAGPHEPEKNVPLPPIPDRDRHHHARPRHDRQKPAAESEPNTEPGPGPQRQERKPEPEPQSRIKPEKEDTRERQSGEFVKPSDLHKFWVVQPSKFECGSSAEAMAISKVTGRAPFSAGEIHQLSRENGSLNAGAFPHGAGNKNMEEQLKAHGVNAETHDFAGNPRGEMNKLDEELAKGHHAVAYIRNPATGHGHFIFIDGKTEDGKYVVGNSGRHTFGNAPPVGRQELENWMLGEKRGSPYFVSVW